MDSMMRNSLERWLIILKKNDLDMVIGSRFIEKQGFQSSKARRIGINYFTGLIKLCTGQKITDPTSGLRLRKTYNSTVCQEVS